ncbi:MAG: hypothetical protein KJ065_13985 [Anaerolineae bacterium]|nr:hypothetical protein [Anaerolineae bacterium]
MHGKTHTATFLETTNSAHAHTLPRDRLFWLTIALLAILLAFILLFPLRAAGDVALYLDTGGRLLDGQRPYIDFFDINPPTIHFFNILPVAVSRLTGLHPIPTFHLFIWLIAAGAAASIGYLLSRARREERLGSLPPWLIPMLYAVGAYIAWLLIAFGQRDHLFSLALPAWAILRWYRWEGGSPPVAMAILIGILGAVGASLKPTFILGFGLVEAYGLLRYHNWRTYVTWEMLGAAIVVGLYGLYFITQPDILRIYLTEVTPSVVAGYRSYGYTPALDLIFGDFQSLVALILAALLALLSLRRRESLGRLFVLIATLGLASVLSFALQTKGWRYHSLPMLNMIFLTGGLLVERAFTRPGLRLVLRRHRLDTAAPILIVSISVLAGVLVAPTLPYGEALEVEQQPFLRYTQPGDPVIIADVRVIPIHTAVIQAGRRPVGRYPMAYPLAFAYPSTEPPPEAIYDPAHTPPPLAQDYLDVLMEDIRTQQPKLILLCTIRDVSGPQYMNVARYVKAHTDIEALLAQDYESMGVMMPYEVYVRKDGT